MKTQADFATTNKDNTLRIGTTTILQQKIRFKGGEIPWFDDNKLLKKSSEEKNGGR